MRHLRKSTRTEFSEKKRGRNENVRKGVIGKEGGVSFSDWEIEIRRELFEYFEKLNF